MKQFKYYLFIAIGIISLKMNAQKEVLKLWPNGAPNAIVNKSYVESTTDEKGRSNRISKVSEPTISIFLPKKSESNGAAILICPGGGYSHLAWDHEGIKIAQWLNKNGIAGILLKYRLPSDLISTHKELAPLQDAQKAMRMIREHAEEWNINPGKIGVIGFSAGGHLAATLSTQYNRKVYDNTDTTSARPDFSALLYPVISMNNSITHKGSRENLIGKNPSEELIKQYSNELQVTKNTPITFIVHAANDNAVPFVNSLKYFEALQKNNIPSELHLFERGGHGFGMDKRPGTQLQWPQMLLKWLDMHKIIELKK